MEVQISPESGRFSAKNVQECPLPKLAHVCPIFKPHIATPFWSLLYRITWERLHLPATTFTCSARWGDAALWHLQTVHCPRGPTWWHWEPKTNRHTEHTGTSVKDTWYKCSNCSIRLASRSQKVPLPCTAKFHMPFHSTREGRQWKSSDGEHASNRRLASQATPRTSARSADPHFDFRNLKWNIKIHKINQSMHELRVSRGARVGIISGLTSCDRKTCPRCLGMCWTWPQLW